MITITNTVEELQCNYIMVLFLARYIRLGVYSHVARLCLKRAEQSVQ